MLIATNLFADLNQSLSGRPELVTPARWVELPSIEPTSDGWVGFNTNAAQMFQDFLVLIERPDYLEDAEMMTFVGRVMRLQEWNDAVHSWTKRHTTDEVVELASLMRIPVAQVNNGKTVLEHEQFVAREFFVDDPTGTFKQPQPPYLLNGARLPAPRPRRHSASTRDASRRGPGPDRPNPARRPAGCRSKG